MSLGKGTVNPLNVLGQRRLQYSPKHFETMNINSVYHVDIIDAWVYYHLNSRYCIRKKQGLNSERKIIDVWEIGFEDPLELTLFTLGCPYLK